ncbi:MULTISPECIES: bifunctional diaminohydroxyphosphoribosylaminopyrimidine deaminase/5-amino-6-(5-phosphoribosylamino)uracil reductase RibD [unclassified Helicobacter]|uniref:bifunctional diaminohydroxyphosphoribosylaminopyrimidine deaminase/5-amino-6-(5-phosphoribosylamino)uracil reductase RibD n=1 Tax=unclassified Helicobacter TaxID=2593540 RepID=UPI00115FCB62|nr:MULTISPECIES: bifunctional diaminohydroxyphosphoribosylaminopyrimidine deaminase/5-amino-6-(5-phosphoribosylamino)uracil reductase RibD [unclassified Helicobacter]
MQTAHFRDLADFSRDFSKDKPPMTHIYELFLEQCINKAWEFQTLTLPNPAVGAMVADARGAILSLEAHQKAGAPHAEVLALLRAYEKMTHTRVAAVDSALDSRADSSMDLSESSKSLDSRAHATHADSRTDFCSLDSRAIHDFLAKNHRGLFHDKTLFLTLEPCNHFGKTPPCAHLIATLKPARVVILARDSWGASARGADTLERAGIKVSWVESARLQQKAQDLLYPFLCWQKRGGFALFKLASRLDGDYKSGQISCETARIFTHNQRCIAHSITISGATARSDKPRLDTRYAAPFYAGADSADTRQKAGAPKTPDVNIFTRQKSSDFLAHFAREIPLFAIDSRRVNIINDKRALDFTKGFHIIEGGFGLYRALAGGASCARDSQNPIDENLSSNKSLSNDKSLASDENPAIDKNPPIDMILLHISPTICMSAPESKTPESKALESKPSPTPKNAESKRADSADFLDSKKSALRDSALSDSALSDSALSDSASLASLSESTLPDSMSLASPLDSALTPALRHFEILHTARFDEDLLLWLKPRF